MLVVGGGGACQSFLVRLRRRLLLFGDGLGQGEDRLSLRTFGNRFLFLVGLLLLFLVVLFPPLVELFLRLFGVQFDRHVFVVVQVEQVVDELVLDGLAQVGLDQEVQLLTEVVLADVVALVYLAQRELGKELH